MARAPKEIRGLWYAFLADLNNLVTDKIPLLGDFISDVIDDTLTVAIRDTLTPGEFSRFLDKTKLMPEVPAMLITFPPPSPSEVIDGVLKQK